MRQVGLGRGRDLEGIEHRLIQPLAVIGQRRLVDRLEIIGGDHGFLAHVAEQRDLLAFLFGNGLFGAADQDIGRDADGLQFLDGVLGRLGLELAAGRQVGQQRQMHEDALPARLVMAELADRLEKGQALDVAHRAADLAEHEIDLVLADGEEFLDLVGDVGDDLDGLAQVIAAALLSRERWNRSAPS